MNIEKVIKVYFYGVMGMVMASAVAYNGALHDLTSLWSANGESAESKPYFSEMLQTNSLGAKVFEHFEKEESLMTLEMVNEPTRAFVLPGSKKAPIMNIRIKSVDKDLILNYLRLKLVGLEDYKVEAVYLQQGENLVEGSRRGDYVEFGNLDLEFAAKSDNDVAVLVDLTSDTRPGDRLRMDVEQDGDLKVEVDNMAYQPPLNYPLRGKYLSIVGKTYIVEANK